MNEMGKDGPPGGPRRQEASGSPPPAATRGQELFADAARHLVGGVGSGTRSPRSGWQDRKSVV